MKFDKILPFLWVAFVAQGSLIYQDPSCNPQYYYPATKSRTYVPPSASSFQISSQDILSGNVAAPETNAYSGYQETVPEYVEPYDSSYQYGTSGESQPSSYSDYHESTGVFDSYEPIEPV